MSKSKLFFLVALLASAYFVLDLAFAFNGPTCTAPSCSGTFGAHEPSRNLSLGSSTATSTVKLLITGSSTDSSYFSLKIIDQSQGPILYVRNDGKISIGTSTFTTSTVLINGRLELASGTIPGGILFPDGTFQTSAGGSATSTPAANILAGTFASSTGGGNFTFPNSLSVTSTLWVGTTTITSTLATAVFFGSVGINTSSPASDIDIKDSVPTLRLVESGSGQVWVVRSGGATGRFFDIADLTDGKAWLTIATSGFVGLGATANPTAPLYITAGSSSASIAFEVNGITASGLSSGPNSGATFVNDSSTGGQAWTNPGSAISSNDGWASSTLGKSSAATSTSYYLMATGFGFNLATNTTVQVNGIKVEIERHGTMGGSDSVIDNSVKIVKGGSITGTDKASGGSDWPASDAYVTYGGSSDLWGTSWTASDVDSSNFGAAISAKSSKISVTALIDHVRITVYYRTIGTVYWNTGEDKADDKFKISNASSVANNVDIAIDASGTLQVLRSGVKFWDGSYQPMAGPFATSTASDYSTSTNAASPVYLTEFDLSIGPNEVWRADYFLFVSSTVTAGFKVYFAADSGNFSKCRYSAQAATGNDQSPSSTYNTNCTSPPAISPGPQGSPELMVVSALVENGSGSRKLRIGFSQTTSNAQITRVRANSYMSAQRIR